MDEAQDGRVIRRPSSDEGACSVTDTPVARRSNMIGLSCKMMSDTRSTANMRILGIDPGLQVTGYAVLTSSAQGPRICEAGIIRSATDTVSKEMAKRLCSLYDGVTEVIAQF